MKKISVASLIIISTMLAEFPTTAYAESRMEESKSNISLLLDENYYFSGQCNLVLESSYDCYRDEINFSDIDLDNIKFVDKQKSTQISFIKLTTINRTVVLSDLCEVSEDKFGNEFILDITADLDESYLYNRLSVSNKSEFMNKIEDSIKYISSNCMK